MQKIPDQQFEDKKSIPLYFTHTNTQQHNYIVYIQLIFLLSFCIFIAYQNQHYQTQQIQSNNVSSNQFYISTQQAFNYDQKLHKNKQIKILSNQTIQVQTNKPKYTFNKIIWLYKNLNDKMKPQDKLFEQINLKNNKKFAKQDNYQIIQVNHLNYHQYISQKMQTLINYTLSTLEQRKKYQADPNVQKQINQHFQNIRKRLIVYFLLLQKGGIFIDNKITIIEKFSTWLENIINLPYINVGDKIDSNIQVKCFGFLRIEYSSFKSKINIKRKYQFEKRIHMFPSLEDQFLACQKDSLYIQKLIDTYLEILLKKQKSQKFQKLNKNQKLIGKVNTSSIYIEGHLLANHIVLQQNQHKLDKQNDGNYRKLAIDDFGLVTINSFLGPRKIQHYFPNWNSRKAFTYLSKLRIQQLQRHTGKNRFLYLIEDRIKEMLINQIQNPNSNQVNYIVSDSFIGKYFVSNIQQQQKNKLKLVSISFNENQNLNKPQWNSYSKHLWTIWDSGIRGNSSFLVELCNQNLRRSAQNTGLEFHVVTKNNLHTYLSQTTRKRIDYAVTHATLQISRTTISDIWRLALLAQHGGIYVDSTTFTMEENFDWVNNITRIPSNFLWNRFGQEPKALLFWNTYYSHPMDWKFNQKKSTKQQWHLSYQSNFMASVKDSELIKQWFDVFLQWIVTPYQKVQQQMKDVDTYDERWTRPNAKYLLVMDVMKYVIGRKQKSLKANGNSQYQDSSDYYKVWSVPGQMVGQLKFRGQANFQNNDYRNDGNIENFVYRFEYSLGYVESINGASIYQSKFFGQGWAINKKLLIYYKQHRKRFQLRQFEQIIHPQSLIGSKLINKYPLRTLYLLSYYINLPTLKLQFKTKSNLLF